MCNCFADVLSDWIVGLLSRSHKVRQGCAQVVIVRLKVLYYFPSFDAVCSTYIVVGCPAHIILFLNKYSVNHTTLTILDLVVRKLKAVVCIESCL